jgi:lysozyme
MVKPYSVSGTKEAAVVIAAAALIATPFIAGWEGEKRVTYLDVVKIPTACFGATGPRVGAVGTRWTAPQCKTMLDQDVRQHMQGVLKCTPGIASRKPELLAATTSLTFNIGVSAYCRSTVARRFNAGQWKQGCQAFGMWIKAGGKVWQGLVNRRAAEMRICMSGAS